MTSAGGPPPFGRSLAAGPAFDLARREAERLGLTTSFAVTRKSGGSVTECRLEYDGTVVTTGLGQGGSADGGVGALFEALERRALQVAPSEGLRPIAEIADSSHLPVEDLVHRIARTHPTARAQAWAFRSHTQLLHYPALVASPFLGAIEADRGDPFAAPYLRYSSSIGSAAGATVGDAVTHGLLELVEHDALSLALLRWGVARVPPERVVDPRVMPAAVRDAFDRVRDSSEREFHLVDITTDLGVPCFAAVLLDESGDVPISGSAAAPSAAEAAIRAIGEVELVWVLEGAWPERDQHLTKWPALERCRRIDVLWSIDRDHLPDWDGERFAARAGEAGVAGLLERAGLGVWHKVLSDSDAYVAVVSCLAPGLERFSLVRYGHPVVPTGRGRALWEEALK